MSDSDILAAYRATIWLVDMPAGEISIRLTASTLPLHSAGIITAYNPASRPRSDEENRAANQRLLAELRDAGAEIVPARALGTGPDADRWAEPGFAVRGLARSRLIALAGRYGQNAIVWIDARGRPSLVVTRPGFGGSEAGDTL